MSGFFSANVTSPFPDENILYNSAAGITAQGLRTNDLLNQGRQMDLTAADHEQVGRLAAGLLNEPDPARRADLYARGVGMLQSQGLAKYAPATLPDEGVLRSLVSQAIPAADQYKLNLGKGAVDSAITALAPNQTSSAAPSTTAPGTAAAPSMAIPARGTGGPGASASAPTAWLPYFAEASKETGIPVDLLIAQARQESGFNADAKGGAGEVGLFQIKPGTASSPGFGLPPVDLASITGPDNVRNNIMFGARYLKARMGSGDPTNPAVQAAGLHAYNGGGDPNYVQNVFRYRPTLAPSDPNAAVTAYTPPTGGATTASAVPAGGVATTAPYTVASNTPVPPPGSTAAPGAPTLPPAQTDTTQPGQPQGPSATAQAPPTPASVQPTAAPPAVPQMVTPNGQAVPPPPGGVEVLSNGLTPQQWGLVQSELKAASVGGPAAIAGVLEKVPALVAANRALNMQAWQAANPELKTQETSTGSILINPRTGQVVGSIAYQPNMQSRAVEGSATWDGSKWVPAVPGQPSVPGKWVYAGATRGEFQPQASIPAQANYDIALEDLKKDRGEIASIGDAGRAAQNDNLRVQEMRDILTNANTGPGTETAARFRAWIARWMPGELSKWDGSGANLSNPAAIEMFQKLGFVGAVTQERGSTPRGGYQATKLFQQFNPGAQLLTSTNQGLLAQRLIANQAEEDYAQGAQDHYNTQRQRLKSPERDYEPLSSFDAKWQAQRNPQVYAAAIGALGGQDPEIWSRGLNKGEIQRVKEVVSRADPNAVIHMPGEGKVVLQPNAKPLPPGFRVQ
jgi:soluble lytic murein transglycosylase-like protein